MEDKKFRDLLTKYESGLCTEEEEAWLESWYLQYNQNSAEVLSAAELAGARKTNWAIIQNKTQSSSGKLWPRLAAAAMVLFMLSAGLFLYLNNSGSSLQKNATLVNDVAPGGNKAFLTLADGRKISLTDVSNGELAEQSGIKITKTSDGQLMYTLSDVPQTSPDNLLQTTYNTIETPKGGQYQVLLPDGTKVWLNAASSLKYPTSFTGAEKRLVELNGEAYFEVKHDEKQPFMVKTTSAAGKIQQVEVLGTHFNINAYRDEPTVKTTLLEGLVRVNNKILKPGFQSVFDGQAISIAEADTEAETAWKNGDFVFNGQDLPEIMRMIGRWYDVDIEDQAHLANLHFGGVVSRSRNLSAVIKMLEETGDVKFRIEGRRMIMIK